MIAEIRENSDAYEVSLDMIAVRTFDNATNKRLSREKASLYAREALLRHLTPQIKGKRKVTFSGVTILVTKMEGRHYHFEMKVPRKSVFRGEAKEEKAKSPEASSPLDATPTKESHSSDSGNLLLNAYADYLETIDFLSTSLCSTVPQPDGMGFKNDAIRDEFYLRISEAEDDGLRVLQSLRAEIQRDKLLLMSETEDLNKKVDVAQAAFIAKLKSSVDASM